MVEETNLIPAEIYLQVDESKPMPMGVVYHTPEQYLRVMNHTERSEKIIPLKLESYDLKRSGILFSAYMRALSTRYPELTDLEIIRRGIYNELPMPDTLGEFELYRQDRVSFMKNKMEATGMKLSLPIQKKLLEASLNYFDAITRSNYLGSITVPEEVAEMDKSPREYAYDLISKVASANKAYRQISGRDLIKVKPFLMSLSEALDWMVPAWDDALGKRMA